MILIPDSNNLLQGRDGDKGQKGSKGEQVGSLSKISLLSLKTTAKSYKIQSQTGQKLQNRQSNIPFSQL